MNCAKALTPPSDFVSSFKCFHIALFKDIVTETLCDLQEVWPNITLVQALKASHVVLGGRQREHKALSGREIASNTLPWKIITAFFLAQACSKNEKINFYFYM